MNILTDKYLKIITCFTHRKGHHIRTYPVAIIRIATRIITALIDRLRRNVMAGALQDITLVIQAIFIITTVIIVAAFIFISPVVITHIVEGFFIITCRIERGQ